jgi:SAM-dependent methyltransferase
VPPAVAIRIVEKARHPRDFGAAVRRRVMPRSERYGFSWMSLPDGSVTFHERGFVAADSPSALLTRHNYETAHIRKELKALRATQSLEVGCGFGRLSMTFAEFSSHHVAVDVNNQALFAARTAYPDISYQIASAEDLPFPTGHFDLVATWTVVQHVPPEKIDRVCSELTRVLAPSGTLLMCEETRDPDASGGHTWHRRVAEYEALLRPLSLLRSNYIEELDRIPGLRSPGEVMVFGRASGDRLA